MADETRRRLRLATIVYWVLLLYIIAALLWWAVSLVRQQEAIFTLQKQHLTDVRASNPAYYRQALHDIEDQRRRSRAKYIGEGGTFLLLILVGAVYIYRSVRRQFRLQQQQQNFVMAITHELKTPIAVARLNLETLQRHHLDETRKARLVQVSLQETMRLDTLINNILISSQLDGNSYKGLREEIDLTALASDVASQFGSRYPERSLHLSLEEDETPVSGDPLLLKLLVSNLLENANKYSPRDRAIYLGVHRQQEKTLLEVRDEGVGIPEGEKKKIFDKFYRIGNEETRTTKGTGLGLYLCRKIAADHGASIRVEDAVPSGSKFIVQFPA
jgi:two-component system sensor histidine kinase CiaH